MQTQTECVPRGLSMHNSENLSLTAGFFSLIKRSYNCLRFEKINLFCICCFLPILPYCSPFYQEVHCYFHHHSRSGLYFIRSGLYQIRHYLYLPLELLEYPFPFENHMYLILLKKLNAIQPLYQKHILLIYITL